MSRINSETGDDRGIKGYDRCTISEAPNKARGRTNSFSKRALQGKIQIIKKRCPHCGHHKIKRNESAASPYYDKEFCTRCKKEIEVK